MELLQLQYFFESAQTENFAKTAAKYIVPTSSVSGSVRRLERELGCQLFDRASNRLTLNRNGKRLFQALQVAFDEINCAVADLTESEDNQEIRLLIRAMGSNMTDCIVAYNQANPHIQFQINFDNANQNIENYDIIIDAPSDLYTSYQRLELCRMRLRLATFQGSPLCRKRLTMKQLTSQQFITPGEQSYMHKALLAACKKAGFRPNIVIRSNDMKYYEKVIDSGIAIGLEPDNRKSKQQRNVVYLDVSDFTEESEIFIYYKKESAYPHIQQFLQFLTKQNFL